QGIDALPLPAAQDRVHSPRGVGKEAASAAEGQLPDVARHEVLRHIEAARASVGVVEISGRRSAFLTAGPIQAFGKGVRAQKREAFREMLLAFRLQALLIAGYAPLLEQNHAPLW